LFKRILDECGNDKKEDERILLDEKRECRTVDRKFQEI
jgi:hypothetical protein